MSIIEYAANHYEREAFMFGYGPELPYVSEILSELREPDRAALEDFCEEISQVPGFVSIKLKNPKFKGKCLPKEYYGIEVAVFVHPHTGVNDFTEESFLRDYCRSSKNYRIAGRDDLKVPTRAKVQQVWKLKPKKDRSQLEVGFYEAKK